MCLYSWGFSINNNENEMENRSHRYIINRPKSRQGHKNGKFKKRLSMLILLCEATPKQHMKLNSWKS